MEALRIGQTADGPASVTVSAARLRKLVYSVDEGTHVHSYPAGSAHSQFLVVDVVTDEGGDVTELPLAVTLDGNEVAASDGVGEDVYRLRRGPVANGSLAFQVPVSEPSAGAVEWRPSPDERYRWTLPEPILAGLDRAPAFDVRRFDVPEAIERGAHFRATIEVENSGDRDGRFLAAVYDRGASSLPLVSKFSFAVPTGGSVTRELAGRAIEGDRSSVTAILNWGVGRREVSFSMT